MHVKGRVTSKKEQTTTMSIIEGTGQQLGRITTEYVGRTTSLQPYNLAGISNLLGSEEAWFIDRYPFARISRARSPAQRMLMGVQPMLMRPFWVAFS